MCTDCDRPVIVIGDIEFELHRPLHCNVKNSNRNPIAVIDKLAIREGNNNRNGDETDNEIVSKEEQIDSREENDDHFSDNAIKMAHLPDDLAASIAGNKPQSAKSKKGQRKPTVKVKTKAKTKPKTDNAPASENVKKVARPPKVIQCTQSGCTEEFRQQRSLRIHLKNQHGIIERVHCPICNFGFTDKSNLKHHMILHTDSKRFVVLV